MKSLVSVIITTKNEAKNIGNCLEGIKKQTYPQEKIEIIVVDNNSQDKTKTLAKKFTNKIYNFGSERSAQRNFGVKKSKGQYLLYLDADMILSPKVIEQSVLELENSDLVALYIPEIILGNSCWAKVRNFERSFYNGTVIDAVRFIKRDALIKSGGFDENLTGPEDWDLDKRIRQIGKVTVLNQAKAVIYHNEKDFNLSKYLQKKSYYLKSLQKYRQKWGADDSDIKKQLGFSYRCLTVFWEGNKWKKILLHPILTFGLLLLKLLVGLQFLKSLSKNG